MPTTLRLLTVRTLLLLLGVVLGVIALATVLSPAPSSGHHATTLGAGHHAARGVVWN